MREGLKYGACVPGSRVDFLPLLPGYAIAEIRAPREFVRRTLRDLALRITLNVQLVGMLKGKGERKAVNIVPRAETSSERDC